MSEEKILIPAYKRSGRCELCGADIYAPDMKERSGWPLMSACSCKHAPAEAARRRENPKSKGEAANKDRAQAA